MNHNNLKNRNIMKKMALLFLPLVLMLASCKKEPTNQVNSNCLLQSLSTSDNSYIEKINYDGNNQVESVELTGSNYTSLVPTKDASNRVYKVDCYNGTVLSLETVAQFDANNRISLVSYYQQGVLIGYDSWLYTNGNRPNEEKQYSINNGNTFLSAKIDYTYDSKGNVLFDGTTTYTYDDKPCALRVLNFVPAILGGNQNNITSQTTKDPSGNITSSVNSTFTYDSNGNPTQRKDIDNVGASTVYDYVFLCH